MISVIVPVHNGDKYIRECIESIERTEEDTEILIVNDGSTDDTEAVCKKLASEYANIRVITTPGVGVSKSRNLGVEETTGEFITFVDADDVLEPRMLSKLLKVLEESRADIAGCRFFIRNSGENIKAKTSENTTVKVLSTDILNGAVSDTEERPVTDHFAEYMLYSAEEYIRQQILLRNNTRCWSKMYRRSVAGKVRFDESLTIGEDMLYLTECVGKSTKIAEMTEYKGYGYLLNSKGAMLRPFTPKYMDQIYCWEKMSELTQLSLSDKRAVAIMLIASKIAAGSLKKRRENQKYVDEIHSKLGDLLKEYPKTLSELDRGYRIKCRLFKSNPKLYLTIYHAWKG